MRANNAACAAAIAVCAIAAPAGAQPVAADDSAGRDGTIFVTATKRAGGEALSEVPASITVIDSEQLAQRQFQDLSSLTYATPGVALDPIGTFRGVANFSIRGLGINSSIPSIDPAVGLFVDGVYMGINAGTVFEALDVTSVELLRGPQGDLFGRNTTGGAVLVNTGDPTWDWQGHARLSFETPVDGNRGAPMATARAVVSGPLAEGLAAIRLGVLHSSDGGYFESSVDGSALGKSEATVLRAAITLTPSDRLTITAKGEYSESDGNGAVTQNHGLFSRHGFTVGVDNEGFHRSEGKFAVLRADYEVGAGTITNIFGWREYDLVTNNDIDSTPQFLFHSNTGTAQEQWSNELRYSAQYDALALTVGAFAFQQDVAYAEDRLLPGVTPLGFYGGGTQDQESYGLFARGDYEITPAVTLTAGLRFSHEEKSAALTYVRTRPPCWVIAGTCPVEGTNPLIPGEPNGISDSRDWSSLSPRLAVSYLLAPDARVYASWTRGHRSGGYNLRVTQPEAFEEIVAASGTAAFDEERVDSFEVGLKWQSADGRARLNAAAYWTEVDDLQREVNVASTTSGLAQSVFNTADARIRGGEIEGEWQLSPMLMLRANAGHIDADYTRVFIDISGDGEIDAADRALALPRAPEWTWGGGAVAQVPIGAAARLIARADFQHRDAYAYTDNNFGYVDGFDNLDASIAVDLGQPGIRVALFGKNLLDEVQFGGDTQLPFGAGPFSDGDNQPFDPSPAAGTFSPIGKGRRIGVELTMDF